MAKNKLVAPVVKWVGGKRQLLDEITPLLPKRITSYCEPFLGGGAVLFSIQPTRAIVNDLNQDLITVYEVIRDDVESLLESLKKHENTAEYFYAIRDMDRDKEVYQAMSKVERASRLIYLNKTCFNGLFRVNSSGEFNSPFGHYKNPNIVNEPILRAVSKYFREANITFRNMDFEKALEGIKKGDFVYFDPPYVPLSTTSNFTGYNESGFGSEEQERLKSLCDKLTDQGVHILLSNSDCEYIRNLFSDKKRYTIIEVKAKRSINSISSARGEISEVLIINHVRV